MSNEAADNNNKNIGLDKLAARVTQIGLILTAIVGFYKTLDAISTTYIERHNRLQQAIAIEETFWKELYGQYLEALGSPTPEVKDARLFAVQALAGHQPPDFSVYKLSLWGDDGEIQKEKTAYFASMKSSLLDALNSAKSSSVAVASAGQEASFIKGQLTVMRDRTQEAAQDQAMVIATPSISPTVSHETQTLQQGNNLGFDIDIFWCAGGDELAKYASAMRLGSYLSDAKDPKQIGDQPIGRVRVRSLPLVRQNEPGYPDSTNEIRFDGNERRQAEELGQLILQSALPSAFMLSESSSETKWYLSVFVCQQGSATVVPPEAL